MIHDDNLGSSKHHFYLVNDLYCIKHVSSHRNKYKSQSGAQIHPVLLTIVYSDPSPTQHGGALTCIKTFISKHPARIKKAI